MAGVLMLACMTPTAAVEPDEILADPALEARARALSAELRCLVCQNQSIDDSNAPLARDLRIIVRERLTAGDSDAEVLDFVVARYGEFVLLRPRLHAGTLVLWLSVPGLLTIAAWLIWRARRSAVAGRAAAPPLSAEEERRLRELLSREEN
jgi:cytochrome c-type biogenesis protein CcmH